MTIHKQVTTSKEGVEVDEQIKPFIEYLWSKGVETCYSCQGDEDFIENERYHAYVAFPTLTDLSNALFVIHDLLNKRWYGQTWFDNHIVSIHFSKELITEIIDNVPEVA